MNKTLKVVMVTGGTGGHIFPGLALADVMNERHHNCLILADKRFLNYKTQVPEYLSYKIVPSGSFSGNIFTKIISLFKIAFGVIYSMKIYFTYKPDIVIGFGGYTTFPGVVAAKILQIPIIIHEQNAVIGTANRFLMKWANVIALTFNNTIGIDKNDDRIKIIGNPVRKKIEELRDVPYTVPTSNSVINIIVTGGSQGAKIFSKVLPEAFALLSQKLQKRVKVFQQCRAEDLTGVKNRYNELGIEAVVEKFFDDMPQLLAQSHIVFSRAGASIISELMAIGRPSILIPIKNSIGNHQYLNAKMLDYHKAAWIINEREFNPSNCAKLLQELLQDQDKLTFAASNARALYINASDKLANIIINFCKYGYI